MENNSKEDFKKRKRYPFHPHLYFILLSGSFFSPQISAAEEEIEFNTDILNIHEKQQFDASRFSRGGYIMPGTYNMVIRLNGQNLPEQSIVYLAPENRPTESEVCLSPQQVGMFGLKEALTKQLTWSHNGQCLTLESLPGMQAKGDLSSSKLLVTLPQAYLEYSDVNWDPPSRWNDGIPGILLDYNFNLQSIHQQQGSDNTSLTGNGTAGVNVGPWRLRADWQSRQESGSDKNSSLYKKWEWTRFYGYRPLTRLGAKLAFGEGFLNSAIFDSFSFTGLSLDTDDSMLPPNLRGYAPEVSGIAKSNARVTISHQGHILYETQVPPGPFLIQDLNQSVSGLLDVKVQEQDGSIYQFQVSTASIPYLTRPGLVRYKLASGRPSDINHKTNGPLFASGEFSWGISNGWSLFGGLLASDSYRALAAGFGRDLFRFGAISFDVTQSHAELDKEGTKQGRSWRVNYSKHFDELNSQISFAGYRFSEKEFMSMNEYLDIQQRGIANDGNSKEAYTLNLSKQFSDSGLSTYLSYSHQTYWDRPSSDRYTLSLAKNFDLGRFKNLNISLSAYHDRSEYRRDDGMYLSLTVPLSSGATASYSMNSSSGDVTHQAGYQGRVGQYDNYQLNAGLTGSRPQFNGNYSHYGDAAQSDFTASYVQDQYQSFGASLRGGATATLEGAALHRINAPGGTRMMIDTGGARDVPVAAYGLSSRSNRFGKAVLTDVNHYYRNRASIDVNGLNDETEISDSVFESTLTEGAIGYHAFDVVSGQKAMALIRLADGSVPPFGAQVANARRQGVGIVNDDGTVWLSGLRAGDRLTLSWDNQEQCRVTLPDPLKIDSTAQLLLPCKK
ncbi:MAG: outer membrane usher protein [Scandinavium sp.]|uniref:outer membrane usher protein n=1 Tax=Scandinavium sp. TaxID=2830653 RepID=UPI003F2FECD7